MKPEPNLLHQEAKLYIGRKKMRAALIAALLSTMFLLLIPSASAGAATHGCYGAGCNGLDPMGRCDSDAITAASMAVTDGMLQLRYSPSCAANWGRYTPYWRTVSGYLVADPPIGIYARVTVWNPGKDSYGVAHAADINPFASSWSQMVNGTGAACTGVEIIHTYENGDRQSIAWHWGPCR